MSFVRYLLHCVMDFLDVWSGADYNISWISTLVTIILFAITLSMYFFVYWIVVLPKCYRLWLCSILSFLICVAIWGAFILLCIGGEWIIKGVF